jgi:cell division protein FtsL
MATLDRLMPPPPSVAPAPKWSPRPAIAAAVVLAAAIAALQVLLSSGLASSGSNIQELDLERQQAASRVHALEAEVAALTSLDRVERVARERLGMSPAVARVYLRVAVPAPEGPLLPRPVMRAPTEEPREGVPWWERLLRAWPFF